MHFIEELSSDQTIGDAAIDKWGSSTDMAIDNPAYKMFNKAYEYAIEMTEREVHQAAEALIHNLNSLQSRSGC